MAGTRAALGPLDSVQSGSTINLFIQVGDGPRLYLTRDHNHQLVVQCGTGGDDQRFRIIKHTRTSITLQHAASGDSLSPAEMSDDAAGWLFRPWLGETPGPHSLVDLQQWWIQAGCGDDGTVYPELPTSAAQIALWNAKTVSRVKADMAQYRTNADEGKGGYAAMAGTRTALAGEALPGDGAGALHLAEGLTGLASRGAGLNLGKGPRDVPLREVEANGKCK